MFEMKGGELRSIQKQQSSNPEMKRGERRSYCVLRQRSGFEKKVTVAWLNPEGAKKDCNLQDKS